MTPVYQSCAKWSVFAYPVTYDQFIAAYCNSMNKYLQNIRVIAVRIFWNRWNFHQISCRGMSPYSPGSATNHVYTSWRLYITFFVDGCYYIPALLNVVVMLHFICLQIPNSSLHLWNIWSIQFQESSERLTQIKTQSKI